MKALNGKGRAIDLLEIQRKGLLAKVHIAKKDLGFQDEHYREILEGWYGHESAAELSVPQLEDLVGYFRELGWRGKPRGQRIEDRRQRAKLQTEKLRERAWAIAAGLENGDKRLQGLVTKICGMERIEWCHDVMKLKRVVAALDKISHSARNDSS